MKSLARCLASTVAPWLTITLAAAAGELDDYVHAPDHSFGLALVSDDSTPAGRITRFTLQSQTWQGIRWIHDLKLYEIADAPHPETVLLFITGGSTGSQAKPQDHAMAFALAKACGGRVAVLPQVPNQPLYDGKKEDDLISETFLRYLDTKDPTWPLLLPMVKSAVRAMDALQAFGERDGKPIKSFVVTGASKRGWTTWLTAATQDPRVIAIAPMVIPTLNFHEQNPHQIEVWGQYSEQIADYVSKGLMEKLETEDGKKLTRIVDPFFYLDRIKIPVLQINGTNDRYWTLDSMNLFWPDIAAPKAVVYLPNAGHGLDQHRDYAIKGVGAVFRHAATGRPLPAVSWEFTGTGNPSTRLDLRWTSGDSPKSAVLWSASAPTQDFREVKWEPSAEAKSLENGGASLVWESQSKDPWRATFGDMTFEIEGLEYHLSTLIQVVGPGAGTGPAKAPSPPSKSLPVSPGAP